MNLMEFVAEGVEKRGWRMPVKQGPTKKNRVELMLTHRDGNSNDEAYINLQQALCHINHNYEVSVFMRLNV